MIGKIIGALVGREMGRRNGGAGGRGGLKGAAMGAIVGGGLRRMGPLGMLLGGGYVAKKAMDRRRMRRDAPLP